MQNQIPEYLVQLRNATRELHGAAEVLTDSDRLLGDAPEQAHFQQFLSAHFLLHKQVAFHSERVRSHGLTTELLDWPHCPRTRALEADLAQLNSMINVQEFPCLTYQSHGFVLGLIYVTEGSCIGNQRVFKAMNRHEWFQQRNCKSFLRTCKHGFAERWSALQSAMNTLCTHHSSIDGSSYTDIERGAIAGFNIYMDYWIDLGKRELTKPDGRPTAA